MLRPTLIIGLGTTGLNAVSEIQKLMYETFGVNRLPIFRFLYLETDLNKSHEETPQGSEITPLKVRVNSLDRTYRNLCNNPQLNMDWISSDLIQSLSYSGQGAGGVRPAGRLLLWGDQEHQNFANFYNAAKTAFGEIVNPASQAELERDHADIVEKAGGFSPVPAVYVVGTYVGGTCSGINIDVGYILRNITDMGDSGALYGVFLVPGDALPIQAGYGNAYGALIEADYFRTPGNYYQEVWPNNVRLTPQRLPPYGITYLVSTEYGRRDYASMSLSGCIKAVALKLFCDLIGMTGIRGAEIADGMNEGFGAYATFGVSAILYPKYALMEAMGCEKGMELCDRWLMVQSYRTNTGEQIPINQKALFEEAERFLESTMATCFRILGAKDTGAGLALDIQEDINRIVRGEEDSPVKYLSNRFSGGTPGSYCSAVNDNLPAAQDEMIRAIEAFVCARLQDVENLDYVQRLLDQTSESLVATLAYWGKARVPNTMVEWNDFVVHYVRRMMGNTSGWAGQRRSVLEDRATQLLTFLKMFAMRKVLNLIISSLPRGGLTTSDQATALPTAEKVAKARAGMQGARADLDRRLKDIQAEILDTSVPIHRVWANNSFDADCQNLRQAYKGNYPMPCIRDVTSDHALDFLTSFQAHEIFARVKVAYQRRFRDHLPPVNVIEAAKRQVKVTRQYAERALCGLLRLNPPARSGAAGIPRFVLGSGQAELGQLVNSLRADGLQDLDISHVRSLSLLDHAVVFYEEKCRITPLTMIEARETMKYHFENPVVDAAGAVAVPRPIWKQQRLAYNLDRRRRFTRCLAIVTFLLDFAFEWKYDNYRDEWSIGSVLWTDLPLASGSPPKFKYTDAAGVTRDFDLDLDPQVVRRIADNEAYLRVFEDTMRRKVQSLGEAELTKTFNDRVKSYLLQRYRADGLNQKTDFYFGAEARRDGFLYQLIGSGLPQSPAATV